jgi:carbon storage regulator
MLVLSRQRDETIMIGDEIEITVVDIRGDKVRLGINAPSRIAVHRKEVYEAIRRENEQAARLAGADVAGLGAGLSPGPHKSSSRGSRLSARAARLLAEQAAPPPPKVKAGAASIPVMRGSASAT